MVRRLARQLVWLVSLGFAVTTWANPQVRVLVGETVLCDGSLSQGNPVAYEWYVTEPNGSPPGTPTSTEISFPLTLSSPGAWTIELTTRYLHEAPGGGQYSDSDTVVVTAKSVVASIELSSYEITQDESLTMSGSDSRWAAGVTPMATWKFDGTPFAPCNGGPPPTQPSDLECVVPPGTLDPGPHVAALQLWDSASGDIDQARADFLVIEVVPFSVDFTWQPFNPDPGELVQFDVIVQPPEKEADLVTVTWTWGDGSYPQVVNCQSPWGCLVWSHTFDSQGWFEVGLTANTADETAHAAHTIEVGDPPTPPSASFTISPQNAQLLQSVEFTFTGSCAPPCSYLWEFGDGATATVQNPTHAYAVPDAYTAQLTVSNDGGVDSETGQVAVTDCWSPPDPSQIGTCYGAEIQLIAVTGTAYLWSTGATSPSITVSQPGAYWVDVDQGGGCWGHAPWTVGLTNCGDPGGDANLDGTTDTADLSDLIRELTDGDGDSVVSAGGGELTAPGGDVNRDGLLDADDLVAILTILFS
jgi:PKD repeat protein